MQKWEYLQIHVESSKSRLNVAANGADSADKKEFEDVTGYCAF